MAPKKLPGLIGLTARIVVIVAVVEFLVMALLVSDGTSAAFYQAGRDVVLLTIFATPLIYYFAIRPFLLAYQTMFARAEKVAFQDPLTGLPNRRQLDQHIERTHASARRLGQFAALLYFDLDGFKQINDQYGHQAGDRLLVALAVRLDSLVRADDMLFRVGGDEFVLVVQHLGSTPEMARLAAEGIAGKLLSLVREPIDLGQGSVVNVGCSVGVSVMAAPNADVTTYVREADQAMYQAKRNGKNCYVVADELGTTWYLLAKTGSGRIDRDHHRLEGIFQQAMHLEDDAELLKQVRLLIVEIMSHFSHEELAAQQDGLHFGEQHRAEHRRLAEYVRGLEASLHVDNAREALLALLESIRVHVQEYDVHMVAV